MKGSVFSRRNAFVVIQIVLLVLVCFAGTALAASGGGEHGAEAKGWVATDTYRVINFAVLFIVLFFILKKPVSQALNGRIEGIKTELEGLEAKKKEAEKKLSEYNEQIASLDREAEKIIAEYIKQGEAARERILEESKKAAEKLEDQARRNIENEFKSAKLKLQKDILEKALTKAETLLKDKITSEDQNRLVDEYLDKVVA
ncbi:MAG: ATP synthase F0 subunit B [Desulfobacterales bacterium]